MEGSVPAPDHVPRPPPPVHATALYEPPAAAPVIVTGTLHVEMSAPAEAVGVGFTVAVTAVLVAETQPVVVFLVSA